MKEEEASTRERHATVRSMKRIDIFVGSVYYSFVAYPVFAFKS